MSIKRKLLKGAIWNSVAQFGSQAINFFLTILLARLLYPEDFGLFGMVTVFTAFLGYFSEIGLIPSLIQKSKVDEDDCNSVFWGTAVCAIVIYCIVYLSAPLVGRFYAKPELVSVTRILFINFLFSPLSFVPEALEMKKLDYDKIALAELSGLIVSGAVAVYMAFAGFGVWSLVAQYVIKTLIRGIFLLAIVRWVPGLTFKMNKFLALARVGLDFTVRNLLIYMSQNIDFLLVGKLVGAAALGIYTFAFRISKYIFFKFYYIIGRMFFPAFVSFEGDLERIRRNYQRISVFGALAILPGMLILFYGIEPIILFFIGEKWIASAGIVKILILHLVFVSFSFGDESVLIALGKLKALNKLRLLVSMVILGAGYVVTLRYGIIGMAWVYTIIYSVYIIYIKHLIFNACGLKAGSYLTGIRAVALFNSGLFVMLGIYRLIFKNAAVHPVPFIAGEVFITCALMALFAYKIKLIDITNKKIDIDAVIMK